ncbi:GDSL-type esterase/lipase family protein [Salegentibacter sp. F188]|uniref:GDSL-type esterase/lipase family protein n=1 Tax=Autumnicola patrickiae TaxID=3075591 RepID=A0ABU3DZD0_9FLAO|nr:GDSL-type esterase/lipase family protein [Salegentibacter sp. F188]MDT0688993.1 GDSL-type esterase/lipase family protein [Salegentibacter sp. F188]
MIRRFLLLLLLICAGCNEAKKKPQHFTAVNDSYHYSGRIEKINDTTVALINSGASVQIQVSGDSVSVLLSGENEQPLFANIELNEKYLGRFRTDEPIKIDLPDSTNTNSLTIYKATEATTGTLYFHGITADKISSPKIKDRPKIEFIGNSITCGMGADTEEYPCDTGEWYFQHNAYLAYGQRVARALDVDFELSCVSGMGMYRNWNDEDQPVMPDVYENLYLNNDGSKKANFKEAPEVVSIALGTNDLSLGDGEKERADFNQEKFTSNYIKFVKMIFEKYPEVKIALLTSPMVSGENNEMLVESLQKVKENFPDHEIKDFEFEAVTPHGCGYHPDIEDHKQMAAQLIPFFNDLLQNNL